MIQGLLNKLFRAREKVAKDLTDHEIRRRRAEDPDWSPDEHYDDDEKPFLEHLEDLRVTLMRMIGTLLIAMLVCFGFHKQLTAILKRPLEGAGLERYLDEEAKDAPTEVVASDPEKPAVESTRLDGVPKYTAGNSYPDEDLLDGDLFWHTEDDLLAVYDGTGWTNPLTDQKLSLTTVDVTGVFMMSVKVALFSAIVVSFPFLLYFLLQFVLPGLKRKEKRVLWPSMAVGFGLFLLGVVFSYYLVLPRALDFFHNWADGQGVETIWTIERYVTFVTRFLLVFGLCFELPVLVMALVKIDILNYSLMKGTRRHAIVAILIFAAIVTPTTDPLTLALLAVPMTILYEACIWIAYYMEKRDRELYPELYEAWDADRDADSDPHDPWEDEEYADDRDSDEDEGGDSKGASSGFPEIRPAVGASEYSGSESDSATKDEMSLEEIADHDQHYSGYGHPSGKRFTETGLMRMKKDELIQIAHEMGVPSDGTKKDITQMILDHQ